MATATVTRGYATWVQGAGTTVYSNAPGANGAGDWSFFIGRGYSGYTNDFDAAVVAFTVPSVSDCLYGRSISIPVSLAYSMGTTTSLYARLSLTAPGSSYTSFVNGPSSVISNEVAFNHSATTLTFSINNGVSLTGKTIYLYLYAKTGASIYRIATSSFGNATLTYSGTYTLTVSVGDGGSVTVKRTSSAGGATGNLSSGAALYYGDVLQIIYSVSTAYEVTGATVNGTDFVSGGSHTVSGNVKVVVSTKLFCLARIGNGSSYDMYLAYIGNGTSYDLYLIYIGNGTSWELYTGG